MIIISFALYCGIPAFERKFVFPQSKVSLIILANFLVLSHMDYCSPIAYSLSCSQLDILLKLQKQCERIIVGMIQELIASHNSFNFTGYYCTNESNIIYAPFFTKSTIV